MFKFILVHFLVFLTAAAFVATYEAFADDSTKADVPWAKAPYSYPVKHTMIIDGSKLGACFASAALLQTDDLTIDRNQMNRPYDNASFFDYLRAYPSYEVYRTGTEPLLREWILAQADNSIDPVRLFSKSLELNQGNVWNALLANYHLLRLNARWWDRKTVEYRSSNARQSEFFNKFIDIRGDLRERGRSFTGEHAGSWYRLWGIMLYRLMQVEDDEVSNWREPTFAAERWADMKTLSMASMAEAFKLLKPSNEDDWRKVEINRAGADAIHAMIQVLNPNKIHRSPYYKKCSNSATYLKASSEKL